MLSTIRRAYLDIDASSTTFTRQPTLTLELGGQDQAWASIRHLTNEERDQIDLQAKVILTKCADRVKELELLDKSEPSYSSCAGRCDDLFLLQNVQSWLLGTTIFSNVCYLQDLDMTQLLQWLLALQPIMLV